ncbi:MAG: hypothetical protein AMJ79_02700 [Phycisphaerae bacterium SM23_30]|nr:MAG: hypothetical protein AMJ79_02700 [Phycisphaerae bacterium SM23_30]
MAFLPLTQGHVAIVDDQDLQYLKQWKWCANRQQNSLYAVRSMYLRPGKKVNRRLHHEVLRLPWPLPANHVVDHKNHNTLDCRKQNLRLCSRRQNSYNRRPFRRYMSSRYKGISWYKMQKRWRAQIQFNGRRRHLGFFKFEFEAVLTYNIAALILHDRFAFLNRWNGPSQWKGDPEQAPLAVIPGLINEIKQYHALGGKIDCLGQNNSYPKSSHHPPHPPGVQLLFDFM